MKKITNVILVLFVSIGLSAQLKVLNNGKVAVRSSSSNYGDVQINIGDGDNTGLCLFKTNWNEPALKITADESYTFLSDNKSIPYRGIGFLYGALNIGDFNHIGEYGGTLNVNQTASNSFPIGLAVNTFTDDGIGIVSQHNSTTVNGTSIYSRVFRGTSIAFASGLGYSNYNFYIKGDGTAYTNGILIASDSTLKTDIKTIESPMQKIMKMRGVSYKYKEKTVQDQSSKINTTSSTAEFSTNSNSINSKSANNRKIQKIEIPKLDETIMSKIANEDKNSQRIGFLAQEIEQIVPEVVRTTVNGTKAIAYTDLIAILVEGMKEQQVTIDKLNERLTNLEPTSSSKINKVSRDNTIKLDETDLLIYPVLDQNIPNPFNTATTIGFYLPTTVNSAFIYVYNMNGVQLKNYLITERGKGTLTIQGSEFIAGMYLYALIADGKVIDTKRMILTK